MKKQERGAIENPDEWEVRQASGRPYYVNKVTGVTTWKRPRFKDPTVHLEGAEIAGNFFIIKIVF